MFYVYFIYKFIYTMSNAWHLYVSGKYSEKFAKKSYTFCKANFLVC